MNLPTDYLSLKLFWQEHKTQLLEDYTVKKTSFIPFLMPEFALQMRSYEVIPILQRRLGINTFYQAINPDHTIPSPVVSQPNTEWIKHTNMVGINVRTIQNFWNVVKYTLTIPACQDSIHLLPIWEPGVVSSLYGIASWNVNPEFFSQELYEQFPHLDTVERQLKVVVNILHALGKSVGMDVIPHTDRYSEIVLTNPQYFEWLQRDDLEIINHSADLYQKVQNAIVAFLHKEGAADGASFLTNKKVFFSQKITEEDRIIALFGTKRAYFQRSQRREKLVDFLFEKGYEPAPATMAPPYRGLKVSKNETAKTIDAKGHSWRDYEITKPEEMSRVFGPLTRFKLYGRKEDNRHWEIDFDKPQVETWEYICERYAAVATKYNFDFMRGDMSHVQMRPTGVPAKVDNFYDPLKAIVNHIKQDKPYFGYFAETFLAPEGVMAYGNEVDHLELSDADSTLGDLQSMVVGTPRFMQAFRWYLDILHTRQFAPNFTIMTADKDDPRFDKFYVTGNELRFFIALFLEEMPSYMGLGFECRDRHLEPAPNEYYTKLYVFQIKEGHKATFRPYQWGKNSELFHTITHIRIMAEFLKNKLKNIDNQWLIPPDPTAYHKIIAWTQHPNPRYLFVANMDIEKDAQNLKIPKINNTTQPTHLQCIFSTYHRKVNNLADFEIRFNEKNYPISSLLKGEGRIYEIVHSLS